MCLHLCLGHTGGEVVSPSTQATTLATEWKKMLTESAEGLDGLNGCGVQHRPLPVPVSGKLPTLHLSFLTTFFYLQRLAMVSRGLAQLSEEETQ